MTGTGGYQGLRLRGHLVIAAITVRVGILLLIGLVAGNTTLAGNSWIFSGGIVCAVAGMVGGMLAPVSEG